MNYVIERLDAFQGAASREGDSEAKSSLINDDDDDDDADQDISEVWTSLVSIFLRGYLLVVT